MRPDVKGVRARVLREARVQVIQRPMQLGEHADALGQVLHRDLAPRPRLRDVNEAVLHQRELVVAVLVGQRVRGLEQQLEARLILLAVPHKLGVVAGHQPQPYRPAVRDDVVPDVEREIGPLDARPVALRPHLEIRDVPRGNDGVVRAQPDDRARGQVPEEQRGAQATQRPIGSGRRQHEVIVAQRLHRQDPGLIRRPLRTTQRRPVVGLELALRYQADLRRPVSPRLTRQVVGLGLPRQVPGRPRRDLVEAYLSEAAGRLAGILIHVVGKEGHLALPHCLLESPGRQRPTGGQRQPRLRIRSQQVLPLIKLTLAGPQRADVVPALLGEEADAEPGLGLEAVTVIGQRPPGQAVAVADLPGLALDRSSVLDADLSDQQRLFALGGPDPGEVRRFIPAEVLRAVLIDRRRIHGGQRRQVLPTLVDRHHLIG